MSTIKRKLDKASREAADKERADFRAALARVANLGVGLKESVIDWVAIGKNARHIAQEALRLKCPTCGK